MFSLNEHRAINYDEKDPFLCHVCGFCKYAKFDYTLTARPICAIEPIQSDEDRKKITSTINTLLEKADRVYKQFNCHKPILEVRVVDLIFLMRIIIFQRRDGCDVTSLNKCNLSGSSCFTKYEIIDEFEYLISVRIDKKKRRIQQRNATSLNAANKLPRIWRDITNYTEIELIRSTVIIFAYGCEI